ncbi:Protoheme IX farnesyltransferase [Dirofilaria immitis]
MSLVVTSQKMAASSDHWRGAGAISSSHSVCRNIVKKRSNAIQDLSDTCSTKMANSKSTENMIRHSTSRQFDHQAI